MYEIKTIRAEEEHVPILTNLSRYYTYDVSEFASELHGYEIGEDGHYAECVREYWEDPTVDALLLQADDEWAGFALVKYHLNNKETNYEIAEFFVARKFRRKGIATQFAHQVFNTYPGEWEVNVWPKNPLAVAFWTSSISRYVNREIEPVLNYHAHYECEMVTIRF